MTSAPLPAFAWPLGLGGLLPFAATALGAALLPGWRDPMLDALAAYGATILAFLGAVHWGLALAAPAGARTDTARLILGVAPALLAWVALLLPRDVGLGLLAGGVLATLALESHGVRRGVVPDAYLRLRVVLSLGAAACLVAGSVMSVSSFLS